MTTALILGAAVWPSGPSPTLIRRARHGARLYHAGEVNRLVGCGGIGRHPPSEAQAIRDILYAEGVPDTAIHLEALSRSTGQNIAFARRFLPPGEDVVIVTDDFHAPRALLVARRLGLKARTSCPQPPPLTARHLRAWGREGIGCVGYWIGFRPKPRQRAGDRTKS